MIDQLAKIVINSPLPETSDKLIPNIMLIVFGALGGISVIIIVWAGMKYTLSGGDPTKTKEAKDQIMYAAIGLAVAVGASSIVTLVSSKL